MTVDGYYPGPNAPVPVLTAPDGVFVRAGLLEAVAEAADRLARLHSDFLGLPVLAGSNVDAAVQAWADLRAALAAAGPDGTGAARTACATRAEPDVRQVLLDTAHALLSQDRDRGPYPECPECARRERLEEKRLDKVRKEAASAIERVAGEYA